MYRSTQIYNSLSALKCQTLLYPCVRVETRIVHVNHFESKVFFLTFSPGLHERRYNCKPISHEGKRSQNMFAAIRSCSLYVNQKGGRVQPSLPLCQLKKNKSWPTPLPSLSETPQDCKWLPRNTFATATNVTTFLCKKIYWNFFSSSSKYFILQI